MDNTVNNRGIGRLGEDIACKYLVKQGYRVVCRNYSRAWGELDIVAFKDNILHFVEVKSVSFSGFSPSHSPEENVHGLKISHIRRIVQTYLSDYSCLDADFQFHVVCVFLDWRKRSARVKMLKNIIL